MCGHRSVSNDAVEIPAQAFASPDDIAGAAVASLGLPAFGSCLDRLPAGAWEAQLFF